MKVKITRVFTSNKDKNGNALVSKKDGKPYTKFLIKTEQHGDKWLSGFQNSTNANWKEGDEVEVIVEENGEYLNFKAPSAQNAALEFGMKLASLEQRVEKLEKAPKKIDFDAIPMPPESDINLDDIPF